MATLLSAMKNKGKDDHETLISRTNLHAACRHHIGARRSDNEQSRGTGAILGYRTS
jgi:hypothetical protein